MIRFKVHRGTNSTLIFIKLVIIQANISFSRQESSQYHLFTEFKTKQVQISCFTSRDIEGQAQPSYRLKSHFRDKGHFNTFILPNTTPNRFANHLLNQETYSTFPFIKFSTIYTNISFSRQGTSQYLLFTEFKTKQIQISCFASLDIEGQIQP